MYIGWLLYKDPEILFRKLIEAYTYRGICFFSLPPLEAWSGYAYSGVCCESSGGEIRQ